MLLVVIGWPSVYLLTSIIQIEPDIGGFPFQELIGLTAYFVVGNICYTCGWLVEIFTKPQNRMLAPALFLGGLSFSLFVLCLPFTLNILLRVVSWF